MSPYLKHRKQQFKPIPRQVPPKTTAEDEETRIGSVSSSSQGSRGEDESNQWSASGSEEEESLGRAQGRAILAMVRGVDPGQVAGKPKSVPPRHVIPQSLPEESVYDPDRNNKTYNTTHTSLSTGAALFVPGHGQEQPKYSVHNTASAQHYNDTPILTKAINSGYDALEVAMRDSGWDFCIQNCISSGLGVTDVELTVATQNPLMLDPVLRALDTALRALGSRIEIQDTTLDRMQIVFMYSHIPFSGCCWEYTHQGRCPRARCRFPHVIPETYRVHIRLHQDQYSTFNWHRERSSRAMAAEFFHTKYDYYAVVDFECTCDLGAWHGTPWVHEIIEFPVSFLNVATGKIDFEFHRYIKPSEHPILTDFCKEFTGIDQRTVDEAATLDTALRDFWQFLQDRLLVSTREQRGIGGRKLFTIVTDGPHDILRFLQPETLRKGLPFANLWWQWIDLRQAFADWYKVPKRGIVEMLGYHGMPFQGRPHCGRDDARAIAQIAGKMLKDGADLVPNISVNPI